MPSAHIVARPVWTSDEGTMAYETARHRWAKIVSGMLDDVSLEIAVSTASLPRREEGRAILHKLNALKHDISNDAPLMEFEQATKSDLADYNEQLSGHHYSWHNAPWLFAECYLYRQVQEFFANSSYWKHYDLFKRQKDSTLVKSRSAVEQMASWFVEVVMDQEHPVKHLEGKPARLLFTEMTALALWGNATDLSLLTNLSLEDIQQLQGKKSIEESQRNVVVNDTDLVWDYLQRGKSAGTHRRIDVILDNAGFELYTDLLYALYLLDSGLATNLVMHAKCFPWFVSDALPDDIESLLRHLESSKVFPNRKHLDGLVSSIRAYQRTGQLEIKTHPFWTTAYSFHDLPQKAPDLLQDLQESHLTIWKGDLNYRKLTNDGLWPHTTEFKTALGAIGSGSGVRVLSLRTNKADTCVGVSTEARVKELDKEAPGKAWVRDGSYAIISYSDGK